ncbi:MAG TPA: redoxin, partial [Solibacterales bacterium]|nr:redoxin [Bryobacterales bacterium]
MSGVKLYQTAPTRKYDPNFQSDTETYEKETTFLLAAELARTAPPGPLELTARLRYQMCDDRQCLPPKRITAAAVLTVDPAAPAAAFVLPAG